MDSSQASRVGLARYEYDFAVHGGTAGAIVVGAGRMPAGAVVIDGIILIVTAIVGTTSTLAIHITGAGDVLAATAEASLTVGLLVDTVCDGAAANCIEVAAGAGCTFTIAVNDLTAGKVVVGLRYIEMS
ncbi:MAG: hypothetical protein GY868_13690 [Deltaproteobacteria bacterium]|nr:hypothetical protein [Deltaproteobacteria bacterium]